jgi:hypothetical protein
VNARHTDATARDADAGDVAAAPLVISEPEALTLLAHLVTSAELCMTEPYDYGVFRLIDAASRLAAAMLPRASDASRSFLEAFLRDVDEKKMWDVRDRERYGTFLRDASRLTAEHLVTRASAGTPSARPRPPDRDDAV